MISPLAPSAPLDAPLDAAPSVSAGAIPTAVPQVWERPALQSLPRNLRLASVVAGALLLASVILTAVVATYLAMHAIVFPPPVVQVSLTSASATIHPTDSVAFAVRAMTGRQLSFTWSFGDGGSARGTAVTHQYTASGYYDVTVIARDPTGQSGRGQAVVTVLPPAPQARASVTYDRTHGYIVTLDASASTGGTDLQYYWDFGDGSPGDASLDPQVTHYFQHPGTYGVTLTVVDMAGQTSTTVVQVTVSAASFR